MKVQQIGAGAVFIGAVVTGLLGAGPAQAAPGISFDNGTGGTGKVGIGDQTAAGAFASATKGNQSLAINTGIPNALGLSPLSSSAAVAQGGNRNTAVAIEGVTVVLGGNNNHGFSSVGATQIVGGHSNNVVTVAGNTASPGVIAGHDNAIVNFGGTVAALGQPDTNEGGTFVNLCGSSFTGQADHINVSPGCALG